MVAACCECMYFLAPECYFQKGLFFMNNFDKISWDKSEQTINRPNLFCHRYKKKSPDEMSGGFLINLSGIIISAQRGT